MQADIAQALVRAGVEVWIANHRSVEGILGYVRRLGALVGAADKATALADDLAGRVEQGAHRRNACRAARRSGSKNGTTRSSPASSG
jgi:iron complex transport system substrate-binding protein